jgi:hypothetical protein
MFTGDALEEPELPPPEFMLLPPRSLADPEEPEDELEVSPPRGAAVPALVEPAGGVRCAKARAGMRNRSTAHDARVSFFMTNSLLDLSCSNSSANGACTTP